MQLTVDQSNALDSIGRWLKDDDQYTRGDFAFGMGMQLKNFLTTLAHHVARSTCA